VVGVPQADWPGRQARELLPPALAELAERKDRLLLADPRPHEVELTRVLLGGEPRSLQCVLFPLLNAGGLPYALCGITTDVTERKDAEAALLLRDRAMQAATQGIVISDPRQANHPVIYASPGFERMTGLRAPQLEGRDARTLLVGPATDRAAAARVREAHEQGRACTAELQGHRDGGGVFWDELSLSPVLDADGRVTHLVGVHSDVSARHALEERYLQAQKMEAIGRLAGGVAHDFNNLLTVINGFSDMLIGDQEVALRRDRPRDPLLAIRDAGERAARLTAQLLAFSRRAIVEPQVLDLNREVESSTRMLRRLIGEDVKVVLELAASSPRVRMDPGQLEQVLMNLAVNSRDAMPRGGALRLATASVHLKEPPTSECAPGEYARLTVADSGIGMTPDVRAQAFEPFFTTKPPGRGTGLGLATVWGIVRQAGGAISVESAPGAGTTFEILLPLCSAPVVARATVNPSPGGSETILLAEDEDAVRQLTVEVLRQRGYHVLDAATGSAAVQKAESYPGPIDLVLTDVVMPDLGGREVADLICAARPGTPVVFMSGYTDDAVLRGGIEVSADPFLAKPFTVQALASKVREALDTRRRPRPEP